MSAPVFVLSDPRQCRAAALAILTDSTHLTRKAGSFLGQIVAEDAPLTPKQSDWFLTLAERAGVAVEA
ncbi:MAG: hypothetical protein WA842_04985 [Croceibacterium sp.]